MVFTDYTDIRCLKVLKPGFRHCLALIHDGANWISLEPLSNYMDVSIAEVSSDTDLPAWFRAQGCIVMPAVIDQSKQKLAPILPFTCVEAIKRLLGIHSWTIWTPYQLYKFLQKNI